MYNGVLKQPRSDLTLMHWLEPRFIFSTVVIQTHANNLEWGLAKSLHQKKLASSKVRTRDLWIVDPRLLPIEISWALPKALCPQAFSVRGWILAFLLDFHRFCGAIEGILSHFHMWRDKARDVELSSHVTAKTVATIYTRKKPFPSLQQ